MLLKKRENISTEAQPAGSKHRSDEAARRKQSQISREPTISSSDLTPRERERERERGIREGKKCRHRQAYYPPQPLPHLQPEPHPQLPPQHDILRQRN